MLGLGVYARHKGVTLRAVQKAIEAGRLSHVLNDKGQRQLISIEQADKEWAENTNVSKQFVATREQRARGVITAAQVMNEAGSQEINSDIIPTHSAGPQTKRAAQNEAAGADGIQFSRARAVREGFDAKLKKLEYETKSGLLVEKEKIKMAFFVIAKQISENMLNITPRIASNLAACESEFEVTQMLDSEIRKALEALSNGKINI